MKVFNAILVAVLLMGCATTPPVAVADQPQGYTRAQLDQMLAPIALYPDTILSHILIAATYPLEVVQAARWTEANPGLDGEAAVAAVEGRDWDPSVKALVAFPDILNRMSEDLDWTQRLGEAFLMQEEEMIVAIQGLRERAYANGHLQTNEHVRVVREREVIYVEPARTRTVYVPYYDPRVVYGPWWWHSYPPVYWAHPIGYHPGIIFFWGSGYHVAPHWFYVSSFHWTRRHVVVVHHHHYHYRQRPRPTFTSGRDIVHYDRSGRWQHNPRHRRGVSYQSPTLSQQYQLPGRYGRLTDRIPQEGRAAPSDRTSQRQWATERRGRTDFSGRATPRGDQGARIQRPVAPTDSKIGASQPDQRGQRTAIREVPESRERRVAPREPVTARSAPRVQAPAQRPQAPVQRPDTPRMDRRESPIDARRDVRSEPRAPQRPQVQAPAQRPQVQAPAQRPQSPPPVRQRGNSEQER